jgi:hypothetical protein
MAANNAGATINMSLVIVLILYWFSGRVDAHAV